MWHFGQLGQSRRAVAILAWACDHSRSEKGVHMPTVAHTAHDMISNMTPEVQPGEFVFVSTRDPAVIAALSPAAIGTFQEPEGLSMLVPKGTATIAGENADMPMRCITLSVYSSLEGVGLTAAVATALGHHNIPCNMVAAYHHDHVFVPSDMCDLALDVLTSLQNRALADR